MFIVELRKCISSENGKYLFLNSSKKQENELMKSEFIKLEFGVEGGEGGGSVFKLVSMKNLDISGCGGCIYIWACL